MFDGLAGKSCLVTGAAQGIGRAIVERLCLEGASVVAADITPMTTAAYPNGCTPLTLDVTDAAQVSSLTTRYAGIDVLVNCAGYVAVGNALDCTDAELERSLLLNAQSVHRMCRAVLPNMIERRAGVIVNIASVVSTTKAAAQRFAYAASKAAVLAMTRSIAIDYIGDGIRCNSISPGTVDTPSLRARITAMPDSERARDSMIERQPMARLGEAREIAAIAALLASEESAFMTGADIVIDGGMSL